MTQEELKIVLEKHKKWLNHEDGGERADLCGADLRGADTRGADFDYSCWTFSCKTLHLKAVCERFSRQFAYHFCSLPCDDPEFIALRNSDAMIQFANKFHRAEECGILQPIDVPVGQSDEVKLTMQKHVLFVYFDKYTNRRETLQHDFNGSEAEIEEKIDAFCQWMAMRINHHF